MTAKEPAIEKGPTPRVVLANDVSAELANQVAILRRQMKQEEANAEWFGRRVQGRTDNWPMSGTFALSLRRTERLRLEEAVAKGEAKREEVDRLSRQIERMEEDTRSRPVRTPEELKLEEVSNRASDLQDLAKFVERMVRKGYMTSEELAKVRAELALVEQEEKKLLGLPRGDKERAVLDADLNSLKQRLAWEEQMVKKQFMQASQLDKTKADIARLESLLTKRDEPKTDPAWKDEAAELIRNMEKIVEQTAEGVRKGIVPLQELWNAEAARLRYKLQILDDADEPKDSDRRHEAIKVIVLKMEKIVEQTKTGVEKGIVPTQELLNSQRTLLEFRLKLAQSKPRSEPTPDEKDLLDRRIRLKMEEVAKQESLRKQGDVTLEQVRQARMELARLQLEKANIAGDYMEARRLRESVVQELETTRETTKSLHERGVVSNKDLRAIDLALAEARIELAQAKVKEQLAAIVAIREKELQEVRSQFAAKTVTMDDVRIAERALKEAKARLSK